MYFAIVSLFVNMRKIGSNVSLGVATLLHGALALASALVVLSVCGIHVNLIQLTYVMTLLMFVEPRLNLHH
jgi:hypothetical protein